MHPSNGFTQFTPYPFQHWFAYRKVKEINFNKNPRRAIIPSFPQATSLFTNPSKSPPERYGNTKILCVEMDKCARRGVILGCEICCWGEKVSTHKRKSIRQEDKLRYANPISEHREDAQSGNPNAKYYWEALTSRASAIWFTQSKQKENPTDL